MAKRAAWRKELSFLFDSGVIDDLWSIVLDYCFAERKWSVEKSILQNNAAMHERGSSLVYHTRLSIRSIDETAMCATPLDILGSTTIAVRCPDDAPHFDSRMHFGLTSLPDKSFKRMILISIYANSKLRVSEYDGLDRSDRPDRNPSYVDWSCPWWDGTKLVKTVAIEFLRLDATIVAATLHINDQPIHRQQMAVPPTEVFPLVTLPASTFHALDCTYSIDN